MWVIQMCEAFAGPPPVMIQGMMKELKLATASSRIVTVETPLQMREGDVPEALPGAGAVDLRGAQQLIGHGLQAGHHHDHGEGELAPDVDHDQRGQDRADAVDEIGRPVGESEADQHRADDAEVGMVDPLPDVGGGDGADHPGNDQDGAQHAAADEVAVQRQRGGKAEDEGEERSRRPSRSACCR